MGIEPASRRLGIFAAVVTVTSALFVYEQAPTVAQSLPPAVGTWTQLTNLPPVALDNCLLMTDGTVFCHRYGTRDWYRLTPSNTGSYQNGTWTYDSSMQAGYAPLYFASAVLSDGKVIVEGGEYICNPSCADVESIQGSLYDPATRTWTPVSPPAGWTRIGDAAGTVLRDGTFMLSSCCSGSWAYFNPGSLTWTPVAGSQLDHYNNEEGLNQLPDGRVLTVDVWGSTSSEIFDPVTQLWTSAGSTGVQVWDTSSHEIGPGVLRPDGTVVYFGGSSSGAAHTAIFNSNTGVWTAGPDFPNGDSMNDAPAALLPNGNILVQASSGLYTAPSRWYEFDKTTTSFVSVPAPAYSFSIPSYVGQMLVLPTGQVLQTEMSNDVRLYNPAGTYDAAWAPTISSVPSTVSRGSTYTISGTQFNGLSEGAYYGDDAQSSSNYPLLRITNNATGHVFYARTHDHSTMGVATGGATVSTSFDVPASMETGASTVQVVANGIPSAATAISVTGAPGAFNKTSPVNGATGTATSLTLSWGASSGATSYTYCVVPQGSPACSTWTSGGTATSAAVTGLSAGTTYTWQVRALNATGTTGANSSTWWTFTTASAPGAFSKTSPANAASGVATSLTLSWGASSGATSYTYCVVPSGSPACSTWTSAGGATSAAITGLSAGTTYTWQVRALNATAIIGADSSTWWTFTTAAAAAPGAFNKTSPSNAAAGTATSLTLSWAASSGATSYTYCLVPQGSPACSTWTSAGTATSVAVTGLSAGVTYTWQVRALNATGTTGGNVSTWWTFTTAAGAPGAFNKISPANAASGAATSLTLSWTASSGAASYTYCVVPQGSPACSTWPSAGTATSVAVTGLSPGVTYTWQVRAINSAGTTGGNASTWWTFTTAAAAPGAFNKVGPANTATGTATSLTLSWGASAGATSYTYCVVPQGSAACSTWPSVASATSVVVPGLSPSATYTWQVRALNATGTTGADASTWWTFRTQ